MYFEAYSHGWLEADTIEELAQKIVNDATEDGRWADYHTPMVTQFYVVDGDDRTNDPVLEAKLDLLVMDLYRSTVDEIVASNQHERG